MWYVYLASSLRSRSEFFEQCHFDMLSQLRALIFFRGSVACPVGVSCLEFSLLHSSVRNLAFTLVKLSLPVERLVFRSTGT